MPKRPGPKFTIISYNRDEGWLVSPNMFPFFFVVLLAFFNKTVIYLHRSEHQIDRINGHN